MNPFSSLTSKILGGVAIAAITFGVIQTIRIEGLKVWPLQIEGYADANTRLTADLEVVKHAQAEAERAQKAADKTDIELQVIRNKEVDEANVRVETARLGAVAAYIRSHPVGMCKQIGGDGSQASPSSLYPYTPEPSGPPEIPQMAAITAADLDDLSREALYGAQRFEFIQSLIREGRAIPDPTMPIDQKPSSSEPPSAVQP